MKNTYKNFLIFLALLFGSDLSGSNNDSHVAKQKALTSGFCASQQQGFIENKGQILGCDGLPQPSVKFVYQQGNTQIFLLERGIAYQFTKTDYPEGYESLIKDKLAAKNWEKLQAMQKQIRTETFRMDMTLVEPNPEAVITVEGRSRDYINYYNRNVLDVHSYDKITYHDIYPGIDWIIYSKDNGVKYDFVVKPGADPSLIKMEFKHHESLTLNEDGSFTLKNVMGSIIEKKPFSFQKEKEISTRFALKENCISFALDKYDATQLLTIDPSLIWATYYGGSNMDWGGWCATDALGNVFLAGYTGSTSNISSGGHQVIFGGNGDAFLVKFDVNGQRLWATYYGGTDGDSGFYCTTDASGNVFLTGPTTSTSNIASIGHQNIFGGGTSDAFLVKFNSNGLRLWSTYYGGTSQDISYSCSTDPSGNVYLAGFTSSTLNIASGGFQNSFSGANDAFLIKFDANGVRQWGTYYGGIGNEVGFSCATDVAGNVYLAGQSNSPSNIASAGHQNGIGGSDDAFLVKFNSSGLRLWATYYGGTGSDYGMCNTDTFGNVYMAGSTSSSGNIATFTGHQIGLWGSQNAFLVKFNNNGQRLWATYYGGGNWESGFYCSIDASGNAYLVGNTSSTFNIASLGYQNNLAGLDDAFLVKFNSSGVRLWGTYYGGAGSESGEACSVDGWGNVYLVGYTSSSSNIASGGYQNSIGGSNDGFLVKFCDIAPVLSSIAGDNTVCSQYNQTYSIASIPGVSYSWILPSGWSGASATNSITVVPAASGTLSVLAMNVCGTSSQTMNITVNPTPTLIITGNSSVCEGSSLTQIVNGSAPSYTWSDGTTGNIAILTPSATTAYTVSGANSFGCITHLTKTITVNPVPDLTVTSSSSIICSGETLILNVSGANNYTWSIGYNGNQISVTPNITTTYSVTGTDNNGCSSSETLTQAVDPCTGIDPIVENNNILIFPNPVVDKLHFEFEDALPAELELSIINTLGQLVYMKNSIDPKEELNLSFLEPGVYNLKIRNDGNLRIFKIIKERH